jgi:hypothetical protein
LALLAVIAVSVVLAAAWALYVPMFQAPDESDHFEYVVADFAAGRLVGGGEFNLQIPAGRPVPDPAYLERATGFLVIAGHPAIKAPLGYGSLAFFQKLDAGQRRNPTMRDLLQARLLRERQPVGYYGIVAGWLGLASLVTRSPSALFFAARLFSTVLLIPTLLLVYAIARQIGLRREIALAMTAITGLLPLTSFVFSYVQPDALSAPLVLAALYASMRWWRQSRSVAWPTIVGLAMAFLLVTKTEYWEVTAIAIAVSAVTLQLSKGTRDLGRFGFSVLVGTVPSITFWAIETHIYSGAPPSAVWPASNPGIANQIALHTARAAGLLPLLDFAVVSTLNSLVILFLGIPSMTFWTLFGWEDAALQFGTPFITSLVAILIMAATVLVLYLGCRRIVNTTSRLARVARLRSPTLALKVIGHNSPVNAYLLLTASVIALEVASNTTYSPQGRYWIPLLLPFLVFVTVLAPRAIRGARLRRVLVAALLGGIAAFAIVGAAVALPSLHARYYEAGQTVPLTSPLAQSSQPGVYGFALVPADITGEGPIILTSAGNSARVQAGDELGVAGWAADPRTGRKAEAVVISIDGVDRIQAPYGGSVILPAMHGLAPDSSGFDAVLSTAGLAPGKHSIAIRVISAGVEFAPNQTLRFTIT